MDWEIKYFNESVQGDILKLPNGLLARYLRMADMMMAHGSNLGLPHTKSLGDGLFELRLKSREGIARVFYCTKIGKKIIMLHCIVKKSDKIPKKDLDIAYMRLKEVKNDDT